MVQWGPAAEEPGPSPAAPGVRSPGVPPAPAAVRAAASGLWCARFVNHLIAVQTPPHYAPDNTCLSELCENHFRAMHRLTHAISSPHLPHPAGAPPPQPYYPPPQPQYAPPQPQYAPPPQPYYAPPPQPVYAQPHYAPQPQYVPAPMYAQPQYVAAPMGGYGYGGGYGGGGMSTGMAVGAGVLGGLVRLCLASLCPPRGCFSSRLALQRFHQDYRRLARCASCRHCN